MPLFICLVDFAQVYFVVFSWKTKNAVFVVSIDVCLFDMCVYVWLCGQYLMRVYWSIGWSFGRYQCGGDCCWCCCCWYLFYDICGFLVSWISCFCFSFVVVFRVFCLQHFSHTSNFSSSFPSSFFATLTRSFRMLLNDFAIYVRISVFVVCGDASLVSSGHWIEVFQYSLRYRFMFVCLCNMPSNGEFYLQ